VTAWLAVGVALGWLFVVAVVVRTTTALKRLPTQAALTSGRPRVSAVVAVRDEAAAVDAAVRSLLGQQDVDIDVVVVDDGSTDGTAAILAALVASFPQQLLVLQHKKLPPGWVAKNYALELGQGRTRGDWILFTDGDVLHGSRALANAIAVMQADRLDHLAVHPRLEAGGFWEAVVLPLYVVLSQFRFIDPRAASPNARFGAGIGAFNLVGADAYRLRGTHARIRGAMLDDRALGRMMRDDGGRGNVMRAFTQVRQRPYHSLPDLYSGIRKGVVGTFGNSALLTLLMAVVLLVSAVAPAGLVVLDGLLWSQGYGWMGVVPVLLCLVLPCVALFAARTMIRFELRAILFFPLGALLIAVCAFHAGVVFLVKGTIEWRGRHYTRTDLANVG
jgi:glycosyltransferase involved in cell wall biosynthesis